jgi:hypothetical protein
MIQAWWGMPATSAVRRSRQEDREFDISLAYIVKNLSQKQKKQTSRYVFLEVLEARLLEIKLLASGETLFTASSHGIRWKCKRI